MIQRLSENKLTPQEVADYVQKWLASPERQRLINYKTYYESKNIDLSRKVEDRKMRNKTPNYFVPTAYYSTLSDTMAGYLFQNIKYEGDEQAQRIIDILEDNKVEIKDMVNGTNALVYNRALEYVYTEKDGGEVKYKFTPIPTENTILIYNEDIEPKLFCAIRLYKTDIENVEWAAEVIYADESVTYHIKGDKRSKSFRATEEARQTTLFSECPVVEYKTEIISELSSFHSVLSYIIALDWLMTGNTNEIDMLVDALLVLGKRVAEEDLKHTDEWKVLQEYLTDDRAEYISKDMSPEFRKYVSELLIQEIHKHSHVIDWYSPDTGITGAASGKALKTRLFDMDMFSKRIEKVYRMGIEKRLRLIGELLALAEDVAGDVEVKFNRTVPSDLEDKIMSLNAATFLSTETKVKEAGFDWEVEKERLASEAPRAPEDFLNEEFPAQDSV